MLETIGGGRGDGERWSVGDGERWSVGDGERWSVGDSERWSVGDGECWSVGVRSFSKLATWPGLGGDCMLATEPTVRSYN